MVKTLKAVKAAQLADQVRDYIAQWSAQDMPGYLFCVTQVTLSTDLQHAILWVDILQREKQRQILAELGRLAPKYQQRLHREIQRQHLPQISFRLDDRSQVEERFDQLLGK